MASKIRRFKAASREWLSHYLPLWIPLFLSFCVIVFHWIFHRALFKITNDEYQVFSLTGGLGEGAPRAVVPEFMLALFSFWVWAFTTNSHNGQLARTSGRRTGSKLERSKEPGFIVICGGITGLFYALAYVQADNVFFSAVFLVPFVFPFLFLDSPSEVAGE